jgi:drug/metabolite transporter (DMT)-like permease
MPTPPVTPDTRSHLMAGPLLMLAAALLFTLMNVIVKLLGPEYNVWDIGFYRFFGGGLLLVAIFGRKSNPYRGHNIRLLIIRGCTGSVAFLCLITAIRMLPLSTAMVFFYSYPAFAAIFSFFVYKERISAGSIACMLGVLAGVIVLLDFRLQGGLLGQTLGVISAVFAGLTVTFIKELRATNGPAVIYLYFCTMGLAACLPGFLTDPTLPSSSLEWLMCTGIVLTSLTAQLLMNQGFYYCRSWEGGLFMTSEVVFSALVGIVLLQDPATWRFWLGSSLVVGSVMILNIESFTRNGRRARSRRASERQPDGVGRRSEH